MSKVVLVTGGAGYIGSHVSKAGIGVHASLLRYSRERSPVGGSVGAARTRRYW
jgi:nucleoside-diphosphate-sugar epimerase